MMAKETEPETTPVTLEPTDLKSADDFKSSGKPARGSNDNSNAGDWYQQLQSNKNDSIRPNYTNARIALENDPAWRGVLAFNLLAECPMVCAPIPSVSGDSEPVKEPEPLQDHHIRRAKGWLQVVGIPGVATTTVHEAMLEVASQRPYHPIRDYLNRLHRDGVWDGEDRLSRWLQDYLGAKCEDEAYLAEVGRRWLLGSVARVMEPGCKFDYMIVTEGEQGIGKSTGAKELAGEDYFGDELPPIDKDDVRAKSYLAGKWIVEIAELDALNRSEASQAKSFLTATKDSFIPKYGMREKHQKRQCVFFGTTNNSEYLKDASGGRRFWPVRIPPGSYCDIEALKRDRDQLWAQAVHEYYACEPWWPDPQFEREHITPQQESRQKEDPWEPIVLSHMQTTAIQRDGATATEVLKNALGFEEKQCGKKERERVLDILRKLGCKQGTGRSRRRWFLTDGHDDQGDEDADPIDL